MRAAGSDGARLSIVASADCNLRCAYCRLARARTSPPWAAVQSALDRLLASRDRSLSIGFTGGEPLLAFPLIRRAVRYAESRRRPWQGLRFALLTNGLLLDDHVIRFLVRHRFDLQISLDGSRRAQDHRGVGTFDPLVGLLARLRRAHPPFFESKVTVALTVSPATVPLLSESIRCLTDRGVENIRLGAAMGTGRHAPDCRMLDRQVHAVFDAMRGCFERAGRVPLVEFRQSLPIVAHARPGWFCGAPLAGFALDADGRRAPCLMATRTYAPAPPPALEPHLLAIRRLAGRGHPGGPRTRPGPALRLFAGDGGRYSSFGRCADCAWSAECSVCPLAAAQEPDWDDPLRVPDFLCAWSRTLLSYRARFPLQASQA